MRYAYVEEGQIVTGPGSLPYSWKNVTGLDKASPAELQALGWLPWELVEVPVGENQTLDGSTIEILADRIVETQVVRNLTAGELSSVHEQYNQQQKAGRLRAYEKEADPLFFKWQRGEATQEEWLEAVERVKSDYPYREE
jgi:hypothetical protein